MTPNEQSGFTQHITRKWYKTEWRGELTLLQSKHDSTWIGT
jgi:hypothetical protein